MDERTAASSPRPRGVVRQVGFALLGTAAALLLAEALVRGLGWAPSDDYFGPAGERMAWVRFDWLLGPRARAGYEGPWASAHPGAGFPVSIDARGFRSVPGPVTENASRVVALLGDSCTFGWGLATDETYAAGLADRARREGVGLEVLNAGFPGDSAVAGPHLMREWVLGEAPDLFVLGYSGNNAFRLSAQSDAERYRRVPLRRLLVGSRLAGLLLATLHRPTEPDLNPRRFEAFEGRPPAQWRRIAEPEVYEASLREMVTLAGDAGAEVVFLLFPRASQVSSSYRYEDPAVQLRREGLPPPAPDGRPHALEAHLLQYSCLDAGGPHSLETLRAQVGEWRAFYPGPNARLARGARAYASGRLVAAEEDFREGLRADPDSPLAHYDLGATLLALGRVEAGLHHLEEAERLSCNVFARYQTILWRVAAEYGIPVVDLMLHFQAHDASRLFIDPAHPSAEARDVIASALWPVVSRGEVGS